MRKLISAPLTIELSQATDTQYLPACVCNCVFIFGIDWVTVDFQCMPVPSVVSVSHSQSTSSDALVSATLYLLILLHEHRNSYYSISYYMSCLARLPGQMTQQLTNCQFRWNYVYFIFLVRRKASQGLETEFTGPESFVWTCIDGDADVSFFPMSVDDKSQDYGTESLVRSI